MRQPWDQSQRFPVITAGGEFGPSRLTKSEPSSCDSCKPEVLCCAQHSQDLPPSKCSGCGWLMFPEGGGMESKAELWFFPSPAAAVQKRLQAIGFCACSQTAQQVKLQSNANSKPTACQVLEEALQEFPCWAWYHKSIRVCVRGAWDNLKQDSGWVSRSTRRCLSIPCFHLRCSAAIRDLCTSSLVMSTGKQAPQQPRAGSLCPPPHCSVLLMLPRARCGLCSAQIRSGILRSTVFVHAAFFFLLACLDTHWYIHGTQAVT